MTKTFLLGAGASLGHSDSRPYEMRPPGSKDFLLRGRNLGLLTPDTYPDLFDKVQDYLDTNQPITEIAPDKLRFDIEEFLKHLGDIFEKSLSEKPDQKSHSALGQTFYYIYELFRQYQIFYTPHFDNYHRLALHRHNTQFNVISLNYDTLFETALNHVGFSHRYGFSDQFAPNSVKLAKPHGSMNWIRRFREGAIAFGDSDELAQVAGHLYSNQIKGGNATQLKVLPVNATKNISQTDLVRSSSDFDVPAIIPPIGGHKQYDRVGEYEQVQNFTRRILSNTDELVIIGCSIREEDDFLIHQLNENLESDIDIKVVCRSDTEEVADKMRVLCEDASINTDTAEFSKYTKNL